MAEKAKESSTTVSPVKMKYDKKCKSCHRFVTTNQDEKVTTGLYLLNEAYDSLGKPEQIVVTVAAASK
jgi:hypothetical protein